MQTSASSIDSWLILSSRLSLSSLRLALSSSKRKNRCPSRPRSAFYRLQSGCSGNDLCHAARLVAVASDVRALSAVLFM